MAAKKKRKRDRKKPTSSRRKPDAMALWGHLGRLSDAMRKGGYAISGPAYAASSMDNCLQGPKVEVRIVDGARVYSEGGKEFATMHVDGDTLVVRFRAPKEDLGVGRFYRSVEGRPGWLEYRRPATREDAPDLEARIGAMLGTADFERSRGV